MCIGHCSKYIISVLFGPFLPYQIVLTQGGFEGEGVKKPSNPRVIPATSRGGGGGLVTIKYCNLFNGLNS